MNLLQQQIKGSYSFPRFHVGFSMIGNVIQNVDGVTEDEYNDYSEADDQDDDNEYYYYYYYEGRDQDDDDGDNYMSILNTILSGTARLNVLLPTATILTFTIFCPLLTNDGNCTTMDRWLMACFLAFVATSCVFFSFTDSFRTATGRLYYGVATLHGIRTFGRERARPYGGPSAYRLRWGDVFHASLSLIAFLTFSLLQNDVLSCYHLSLPRKFINIIPLVVGFLISTLFVLFPSPRRGIGYTFWLQSDSSHARN